MRNEPLDSLHLGPETLARLVDDPLGREAEAHLASCPRCREELDAMVERARALAALPPLRPPAGGWAGLSARLEAEGLLRGAGVGGDAPALHRSSVGAAAGPAGAPSRDRLAAAGWLRAAAAVLLFAAGVGTGWGIAIRAPGGSEAEREADGAASPDAPPAGVVPATSDPGAPALASDPILQAEELVEVTGDLYRTAVWVLRDELEYSGRLPSVDPVGKYMALETVVAATREAMRSNPADPFLNGLLITADVERTATLRGLTLVQTSAP